MRNLLNEFFNSRSDANKYLDAAQQEEMEKDFQEWMSTQPTMIVESVPKLTELPTRERILQLLQDSSEQYGDTYEQRAIYDSNFGELADCIIKMIK